MRRGLAAVAALVALAAPAAAAGQCPQTTLGDVEDEVMCPVCGTPLSTATEAPQAQRERELIVRLIERCQSKEQIKRTLAAEFGDDVLALPDDEGFDLAAYLVPALALLAAAAALGFAVVSWRRARGTGRAEPDAGPASPGSDARLDADLERYDL